MAPMRRKSHGSIRSPHVKRNVHSQVTFEDWLFKLEGGALKQWKQRWCVLVDFCLFFYKAPHEEKVISSILLPSYKINPCSTDDRISKKYAFKAEHQNMKTYYFAAENKESMKKWMNVMSLATIMQNSGPAVYDEDDDSGFTSYRSCRHPSSRSSSVQHRSSSSEPLKQRSNSCGDRVGEMYLGNDDQYPNLYKSSSSQFCKDVPMKQPLYANAPPKPRRLTHADGFEMYPGDCFESREPDVILLDQCQQSVDILTENRYANQSNSMQYLPAGMDANGAHYMHSVSSYPEDELVEAAPTCENFPDDVYKVKPLRPRSADFLERENECSSPQYTSSHRYENRHQPQRPKSSLECYNRRVDCEDYDFDDYREAVRVQADNFYANNRNLLKSRNIHENPRQAENIAKSDPRLNMELYEGHNNSHPSGGDPLCFPQTYSQESCNRDGHLRSDDNRGFDYQCHPKPNPNESMQRLLEWKQRMLQSPLCRRNRLHSTTSSDVSSLNSSKQANYGLRNHVQDNSTLCQNQIVVSSGHQGLPNKPSYAYPSFQYRDTSEMSYRNQDDYVSETTKRNSENPESAVGTAPDSLYQKNIMYCVDSENNEILFSYDDPSPPPDSSAFHSSHHYPPQMHSFSTLPNVNDIGIEPLPAEEHCMRNENHPFEMSSTREDPGSTRNEKQMTYSSDDEDEVLEDCNLKKASMEITSESFPDGNEESLEDPHFKSSSPDYVNIGSMFKDYDQPLPELNMYSSDFVFGNSVAVNQAVLKQLDQVSKNKGCHDEQQQISSLSPSVPNSVVGESQFVVADKGDSFRKGGSGELATSKRKPNVAHSPERFGDEIECDIKREDYYRASQIFYSSMRMKNRLGVSPKKNNYNIPEQSFAQDKSEAKKFKSLDSSIDSDVGLPLPASKESSRPELPSKELLDSCISMSEPERAASHNKMKSGVDKSESEVSDMTGKKDEIVVGNKECKGQNNLTRNELKKNLTYEEMRGQLLRKREAPPPNIVQERIRKFEEVEKTEEIKKMQSPIQSKISERDLHCVNRSSLRRNHLKSNCSKPRKRAMHSDSEALPVEESDLSSDELTMKSAPLPLSPLSSVLVDLRKTADSGKENVSGDGTSLRESFDKNSAPTNHTEDHFDKNISLHPKMSKIDFVPNFDDTVYLPMCGIRAIKEPEYVTMSDSKLSPCLTDSLKQKLGRYNEEHVYNEPFSPPPSFLHDVYGKQKAKQFLYEMESSSDDSLTENIYEKPVQRFSIDGSRNSKRNYTSKAAQETNFVLMNSLSCSNVSSFSLPSSSGREAGFSRSKSRPHHYEQAHISVSVPDLLQLQDVKDSDASDADDEASRDFDTAGCSSVALSLYQTTRILDSHSYAPPSSAGCILQTSGGGDSLFVSDANDPYVLVSDPLLEKEQAVKNCHRTLSLSSATGEGVMSLFEESKSADAVVGDRDKGIHVRKLRVYTKGKKPEVSKIFPVPFNVDEAEFTQEKNELDINQLDNIVPSLSENVAYISKADIHSNSDEGIGRSEQATPQTSYAPDIISSIKEEERTGEGSLSKSSTSAPYYYSDLYSGYGINFSSQLPILKQLDLPYIDKTSPPKSSTSLLNNIRPKSPCMSRTDIGRKVNNIKVESKGRPVPSDKQPILKHLNDDETKNNIRHSIGVFQVSESKYLHAEKNRYEAGSTLEKTRPSNAMSYFKHRASTPDINLCQYQSNEPVYENILFQSKRVSQSLEEINGPLELHQIHGEPKQQASPVYENVEFFNRSEQLSTHSVEKSPLEMDNKAMCFQVRDLPTTDASSFFASLDLKQCLSSGARDVMTTPLLADDDLVLSQDALRCASRRHYHRNDSPVTKSSFKTVDELMDSLMDDAAVVHVRNVNDESTCHTEITYNVETPHPKCKVNDSDSISDATSSCDEASADSDSRHRTTSERLDSENLCKSVAALDITAKEALHLKKLVQQSHGLMCKGKRLSVSAGDLLGKTHEELVLLLIQLRRNQSKILKAREKLESKMKKEGILQIENHHYEELCSQIVHLEKQYEVTQPLVTLVDNMVKLGSLYGSSNRRSFSLPILDSSQPAPSTPNSNGSLLQMNMLSKLLKEENHLQKQIRVMNKLGKTLQNETNSISTLHQDKEMLEHTLFGMRSKILDHQDRPIELQKLRKQQKMIEKELIRVKRLLSTSAKKIEDATSKNDQMEQEILHLRQILQQALKSGSAEMKASQHSRADLEAELTRLQSVLDELANHRHEINNTVEKLKSESSSSSSSSSSRSKGAEVRASPTGVAGSAPLPLRKKHHCMYLETDLDTMVTRDLAVLCDKDIDDIPVYANAEEITLSTEEAVSPEEVVPSKLDPELCSLQDINEADERMKRFYGILPKEKPSEIKTVRIVKRQSERRSRERDKKKVSYDEQSSVWIMEEPDLSSDDYLEVEESTSISSSKKTPAPDSNTRPVSIHLSSTSTGCQTNVQSAHERLFGSSSSSRHGHTRTVKKSKRRHYTVSGYQYMLDPQFAQYFSERPRSRDDVDMERCLRTANTPDIVRSTIKKNDVFDEKLIDRELGLPQKIDIPERYVEIEPEHLSATEKLRRSLKAENICKMLSETTTSYEDVAEKRNKSPEALHKKLSEEKRKRAQLLSLNQALAREVVERSKAVAANVYPLENQAAS